MKLPQLNERVVVLLPGSDRKLISRVEESRGGDTVGIAPPSDAGRVVQLAIGEPVAIEWTTMRGLLHGDGVVAARAAQPVPLVQVRFDESYVAQRRDHLRVECVVRIVVEQTSGVPVTCSTRDLSGGGMRAFVPLELAPGEHVRVTVALPDEAEVELVAQVIRGKEVSGYAFRFVEVDPADRERMIRWVFGVHRREFAALRRSA